MSAPFRLKRAVARRRGWKGEEEVRGPRIGEAATAAAGPPARPPESRPLPSRSALLPRAHRAREPGEEENAAPPRLLAPPLGGAVCRPHGQDGQAPRDFQVRLRGRLGRALRRAPAHAQQRQEGRLPQRQRDLRGGEGASERARRRGPRRQRSDRAAHFAAAEKRALPRAREGEAAPAAAGRAKPLLDMFFAGCGGNVRQARRGCGGWRPRHAPSERLLAWSSRAGGAVSSVCAAPSDAASPAASKMSKECRRRACTAWGRDLGSRQLADGGCRGLFPPKLPLLSLSPALPLRFIPIYLSLSLSPSTDRCRSVRLPLPARGSVEQPAPPHDRHRGAGLRRGHVGCADGGTTEGRLDSSQGPAQRGVVKEECGVLASSAS
jgi:hypothetical protein